jgi:hypothetical protein
MFHASAATTHRNFARLVANIWSSLVIKCTCGGQFQWRHYRRLSAESSGRQVSQGCQSRAGGRTLQSLNPRLTGKPGRFAFREVPHLLVSQSPSLGYRDRQSGRLARAKGDTNVQPFKPNVRAPGYLRGDDIAACCGDRSRSRQTFPALAQIIRRPFHASQRSHEKCQ